MFVVDCCTETISLSPAAGPTVIVKLKVHCLTLRSDVISLWRSVYGKSAVK